MAAPLGGSNPVGGSLTASSGEVGHEGAPGAVTRPTTTGPQLTVALPLTGPTTGPQPAASEPDLAGLFARIPRVDAVRRRPRPWGLVGWGARHWVALAAASVVMFALLGGFGARAGWGADWTAIVVAASLLGGFVLAAAVPRAGARLALSSCGALPLVGILFVPAVMNPADLVSGGLGLGLLVLLASRQVMGASC